MAPSVAASSASRSRQAGEGRPHSSVSTQAPPLAAHPRLALFRYPHAGNQRVFQLTRAQRNCVRCDLLGASQHEGDGGSVRPSVRLAPFKIPDVERRRQRHVRFGARTDRLPKKDERFEHIRLAHAVERDHLVVHDRLSFTVRPGKADPVGPGLVDDFVGSLAKACPLNEREPVHSAHAPALPGELPVVVHVVVIIIVVVAFTCVGKISGGP